MAIIISIPIPYCQESQIPKGNNHKSNKKGEDVAKEEERFAVMELNINRATLSFQHCLSVVFCLAQMYN